MTLENYTLKLDGVNATGAGGFAADSKDVSITSSGAPVTAETKSVVSAKLNGFGTLKASGVKEVTFVADADMKSGEYRVKNDTGATLKTFDASKASANLSLTTDLVSVNGGVLKGGRGNDTILVTANAATHDISVSGGQGADLFRVADDAGVLIADYKYAEGDKISVGTVIDMSNFDTAGNMVVGNDTSVKGSSADGLYKFGVIDGSDNNKKYDYVAVANNADVKYTAGTDHLVFQAAAGNSNIVIDASKAASTSIQATGVNADITLGGTATTENDVSVGGADNIAVVDLGYGKDTITAKVGTALTLKIGREDGANTLAGTLGLDSNDTLVLTTGKISDVSMSGTELRFGATSVKGAFAAAGTGEFNVQFGSGEAEKLAYTTTNIAYNKDVDYYLGDGDSTITVANGSTDDVVLDMVNFTKGIASVDLTGIAAKANVDIIATGNASIKATVAHSGFERKFDLTAKNIVGPTPKQNYLNVGAAAGVDRIVLSDAKGNADIVDGFNADEDILVLSDVDKLTEKTFTVDGASNVGLHNSKASIKGAWGAGDDLKVVLADGTAKKVALAANGTGVVTATQKTTTVINQTNNNGKVTFGIDEATENNAAFVVDMTGTVSNAIDYLGKFTAIDATVNAADALIVGNEAITNIDVTGSADHGAAVWSGAKVDADIKFNRSAIAVAGGVADAGNILWTGALDGASSVTGFDDKDKLYVYGVDGLSKAAIVEGFDFDDNNNVVYKTGESSMTFNGLATGNINVMYMDSTAEGGYGYQKVAFDTAVDGTVSFATDVDVYIGNGNAKVEVANDKVAEGEIIAINLSNKGAGSVEEGGAYYKDIHNIDASASAGTFLLIGDNTDGARLTGGVNGNAIWGGGNAGQIMTGSTGVADIFWFGSKDGYDRVNDFEKEDFVYLYDATSIDAVKITADGNNAKVVFEATECTLTLTNVSNIDDVKFMLNTADGGYAYYKYDSKTSEFVQQKA